MSFTNHLENELLDHVFGGADYARPATLYIGLSSTAPADDGTNITEPDGADGYARASVTNNATKWPAAAAGSKSNGEGIAFPAATGDWGAALTHFFIADAAVAGNILGSGTLAAPTTVLNGETVSFAAGDLVITLD